MNNNVSVQAMLESVQTIRSNIIAPINDNVANIVQEYRNLAGGTLSSQDIDSIVSEINNKTTALENDFNNLITELTSMMTTSSEEIDRSQKSINANLGQ